MLMFDQDNKIIVIANKAADLVILSIMWLMSCLPLFTIGAACASAYNAVIQVIRRDSGRMVRDYWAGLKDNLRTAWALTLGLLAAAGALAYVVVRLWPIRFTFFGGVYFFMSCFFVLTVILYAVHLFCLCGRFPLPRMALMKVALWMTFSRPLNNLLLTFVLVGLFWMTETFPPFVLILPGAFFWFLTYLEEPAFHRFINYDDDLAAGPDDDVNPPATRSA